MTRIKKQRIAFTFCGGQRLRLSGFLSSVRLRAQVYVCLFNVLNSKIELCPKTVLPKILVINYNRKRREIIYISAKDCSREREKKNK